MSAAWWLRWLLRPCERAVFVSAVAAHNHAWMAVSGPAGCRSEDLKRKSAQVFFRGIAFEVNVDIHTSIDNFGRFKDDIAT